MKIWSMLMLVALALPLMVACGGDDNDDDVINSNDTPTDAFNIVGTWRIYFTSNDPSRGKVYDLLTFSSDHTGYLIEEVGYGSDSPDYYTWTQTGNIIRVVYTADESVVDIIQITEVIDNNTAVVTITHKGKQKTYTCYRDSGGYIPDNGNSSNNDTINNPMTVAEIYSIVAAMPKDEVSTYPYCAKGKICSIKYPFSAEYGTSVFNISDSGYTGSKEFTVYATYYKSLGQKWVEGNPQISVGDEVVVYGKVVNYRGKTPEFAENQSYIVTINGK